MHSDNVQAPCDECFFNEMPYAAKGAITHRKMLKKVEVIPGKI
jgi:hypothetical protein